MAEVTVTAEQTYSVRENVAGATTNWNWDSHSAAAAYYWGGLKFDLSAEIDLVEGVTIDYAYITGITGTTSDFTGSDETNSLHVGDNGGTDRDISGSGGVYRADRYHDEGDGFVTGSSTVSLWDDKPASAGGTPTTLSTWSSNLNTSGATFYTHDFASQIDLVVNDVAWDASANKIIVIAQGAGSTSISAHRATNATKPTLTIGYTTTGGPIEFDINQTGDSTAAGSGGASPADADFDAMLSTAAGPLTYTNATSTAYLETVVGTALNFDINQTGSAPTFGGHVGVTNPESGALFMQDDRVENLTMTPTAWTNTDNSVQSVYQGYIDSMEAAGYNGAFIAWSDAGNSYDGATTDLVTAPGAQSPANWYQIVAWWHSYAPNFAQYCGVYMTGAQVNDTANHTDYVQSFTTGPLLLANAYMDVAIYITDSAATAANIAALCSTWQANMGSRRLIINLPANTTTYTTGEVATIAAQVDGIWIRFAGLSNTEEEVSFAEIETILDHYDSTAPIYAGAYMLNDYDERLDVVRQAAQKNGIYRYMHEQWSLQYTLNDFDNDQMAADAFSAAVDVKYGETELETSGAVVIEISQTGDSEASGDDALLQAIIPVDIVTSQTADSEAVGDDTGVVLLGIAGATRDFVISQTGESEASGDASGGAVFLGTDDPRVDVPSEPSFPSIPTTG